MVLILGARYLGNTKTRALVLWQDEFSQFLSVKKERALTADREKLTSYLNCSPKGGSKFKIIHVIGLSNVYLPTENKKHEGRTLVCF